MEKTGSLQASRAAALVSTPDEARSLEWTILQAWKLTAGEQAAHESLREPASAPADAPRGRLSRARSSPFVWSWVPGPAAQHRLLRRIRADIQVHVGRPGHRETVLLARDWSTGGLFLRTVTPYPPGTRLEMTTVLGHPPARIFLSGVVVRASPQVVPGLPQPSGMAVALDTMPPPLARALADASRSK